MIFLFCAVIPLFFLQTSVLAESIPETVPLSGVYDPNGYLSQEAVEKVATFNWAHTNADEKRAVKLAIVIVNNLDGEINSISEDISEKWGVGYSAIHPSGLPDFPPEYDVNNGILLVVAVREGKVVIKTAYENYLPLDNNFLSEMNKELEGNFEKQQYSQGIVSFVYSLEDKLNQKDEAKNNKIIKFGLDKNKKLTPEEKTRLEIAEGAKEGEELLPIEEGSNGPRKTIGDYEYTGRTDVEGGVTTHVYAPIRYEIPSDAPQYNIPELKVTRHVDEKDKELIETEKGIQPPRKTIDDHEYTGHTAEKDGITTHVYEPIKHEVPGDAPKYDIPELKVTRHVDEKDKELIETEKGLQPPRKTIGEHEYTGLTTEKDGITTHVYKSIKHEVPGDAPIVDIPELKATRYVNEKGEEIKESEAGFIDAPKTIGDYEFTGKTELNDGKDVQTHIYKLVEKPVMPTPDPKKPETRQPEAPKSIETPKSNDSVVVESAEQPQFVKNELPKTGETNSNLALVGVSVLTSLGSIGFIKRKREE